MRTRVLPDNKRSGAVPVPVPVYLNVYDLTPLNNYAYWVGLGVYHSGVQVHGVEYGFGAHENSWTGVFKVEPKRCPGFTFRKSILIGRTDMDSDQVCNFMEHISEKYAGNTYNLITRNCNHFCNDVCINLTGQAIPRWINRLARFGVLCKCVLPAAISEKGIRHGRVEEHGVEKKGMKYSFTWSARWSVLRPEPLTSSTYITQNTRPLSTDMPGADRENAQPLSSSTKRNFEKDGALPSPSLSCLARI